MVLVALAVRLAVIPFVYHDWMDPFVLEHWAFGRIARSIASGHGFGSPFADTGLSALLPPVYSYLLAGIFKIFSIETRASVLAALSLNSLFSALTCVPVFLLARQAFGERVAKWAGWGWAFSPYGVYYGADWAWSTCLVTLELCWLFLFAWRLENSSRKRDWLLFGAHRTRGDGRSSLARNLQPLPSLPARLAMESSDDGCRFRGSRRLVSLAGAKLHALPPIYSRAQRLRP